jgi:lysophospholipase L1-like esterase
VATVAVAAIVPSALLGARGTPSDSRLTPRDGGNLVWQAAWRDAPQPPLPTGASHDGFAKTTIRMVVDPSASGQALRVRLSNAYGEQSLAVGAVSVADQQRGPVVVARSQRVVTFGGAQSVAIPSGSEAISDPVPMTVRRGQHLVVSVYLPTATGPTTWHSIAQATTYVGSSGNWTAEPGGSPFQTVTSSWFFLDGVDVASKPLRGTVVAFGDSITDGHYSTIDADATYPDRLADRLPGYAVVNEGIGGNQLLADTPAGGVAGEQRFARDALDQPGVTDIVFLEGVNDIGAGATAEQLIDVMARLVQQAHARCITVIGGTITPFERSVYDTPAHEQTREAVNAWIRTSGVFDGVVDFDKALRDPADPLQIDPRYHTVGDLHPNDEGYRVMADAIDPKLLTQRSGCAHG